MLQFQNLRSQCLAQVQDGAATELLEVHLLRHLFAHLVVRLYLLGLAQFNLLVLILHLTVRHHHAVTVNLKVTLVGVHDHVEVLIRAVDFRNHVSETLLKHTHQCRTVNVLGLFEFLKGLNH